MKLALIPPKGLEQYALRQDFHLMLAQVNSQVYRSTYLSAISRRDYVVMDNGAAEGAPVPDLMLLQLARTYRPAELVLPDVLRQQQQTINRVAAFLRMIDSNHGMKYMAVLQGQSYEEIARCAAAFAMHPEITAVGVPRHLINTLDDITARRRIVSALHKNLADRFELHLLGTNPRFPKEVYYCAKYHPYVRSVDTSMPFNYAIAKQALTPTASIWRPEGYFDRTFAHRIDYQLLEHNVEVMRAWSRGEHPSGQEGSGHGYVDASQASTGGVREVPFSG
jgi:hypothetical protein